MLWYLTGTRKSRRAQCPTMAEKETDQQENENPAEDVPCRATSTIRVAQRPARSFRRPFEMSRRETEEFPKV